MIICGHALIGKSTLAEKEGVCIDLESSVFCGGDFDAYLQRIIALHQQGKVVLASCHAQIRERLLAARRSYFLVLPHPSEKQRYYDLAKKRQPHPLQPELVLSQWEKWQKVLSGENVYHMPAKTHLSQNFVVFGRGKYGLDPIAAKMLEITVAAKGGEI